MTAGPGWSSNPEDLRGPQKGEGYFGIEAALGHRWNLWQGGALTVSGTGFSELYVRNSAGGVNRLSGSAALSQRWREITFTLSVSARTSMNQPLTRHDSASQEASFGVSRGFTLAPDVTLTFNGALARRFYQDGSEDQSRARIGAILARKWGAFTFRIGGGIGYALEDKTPILPRIRDRSVSASIGGSYEWAKDRDISLRLGFIRIYSSYSENRTKVFTLAPQMAATFRF